MASVSSFLDILDTVVSAIGPLQEVTDILSGEQCITSSAVSPYLKLYPVYNKMVADDCLLTQGIRIGLKVISKFGI